jgi:hypothetical protein
MAETEDYDKSATPLAHKTSHQDGGSDEISVEGLAGELTAEQKSAWAKISGIPSTFAPSAHKTSHQLGGSDALSVAGLSGLLADGQTPLAHKTSHQLGGSDALSVAGLSGLLADGQTPLGHKTSHQLGGSDALSVAGLSGLLADAQTPLLTGLTTGYLPYKSDGGLANSPIYTDGTYTAIGGTTSSHELEIQGNIEQIPTIMVLGKDTPSFILFQIGKNIANGGSVGARCVLSDKGLNGKRWDIASGSTIAGALTFRNNTDNILGLHLLSSGYLGIGKIPTTLLDVAGKIRTDVTLNTGLKVVGHYFTMNINGTDVNVLCE